MNNTIIVWGKPLNSNMEVKLHREDGKTDYAIKMANSWIKKNQKYYKDMRIAYFNDRRMEK